MDIGEMLIALENHIYMFAKGQFEINRIPPTTARIIMECVYSKFQEQAIAQMIANQTVVEGEKLEKQETIKKTGEIIDFMKDFYNTGFEPDKPNDTAEDSSEQEVSV